MPTYDYQCVKCQSTQEEFHNMEATPDIRCHTCDGHCLKTITKAAPVIFKGMGWSEGNNPHEKVDRLNGRKRKVKNA